jgi:hypothetical protein
MANMYGKLYNDNGKPAKGTHRIELWAADGSGNCLYHTDTNNEAYIIYNVAAGDYSGRVGWPPLPQLTDPYTPLPANHRCSVSRALPGPPPAPPLIRMNAAPTLRNLYAPCVVTADGAAPQGEWFAFSPQSVGQFTRKQLEELLQGLDPGNFRYYLQVYSFAVNGLGVEHETTEPCGEDLLVYSLDGSEPPALEHLQPLPAEQSE